MRNPPLVFALSLLAIGMLTPRALRAQLEGGTVLVLPMPNPTGRLPLRVGALALDAGYAGLAPAHVAPVTLRAQLQRNRLALALGGAVLPTPTTRELGTGWLVGAGAALLVRRDPSLLWVPGVALFGGADYSRIPVRAGGEWRALDVPAGAWLSVSGPLSGRLARGWLAPRAQLRLTARPDSALRAGVGLGTSVGVMIRSNPRRGPQWGARLSSDLGWVSQPYSAVEWGAQVGVMMVAR